MTPEQYQEIIDNKTKELQQEIHEDIELAIPKLTDIRPWWKKLLGVVDPVDIRYQSVYDTCVLRKLAEIQYKLEILEITIKEHQS